jgi:hypothetical protein
MNDKPILRIAESTNDAPLKPVQAKSLAKTNPDYGQPMSSDGFVADEASYMCGPSHVMAQGSDAPREVTYSKRNLIVYHNVFYFGDEMQAPCHLRLITSWT